MSSSEPSSIPSRLKTSFELGAASVLHGRPNSQKLAALFQLRLNSSGLAETYSAQSSRIIRCTSSLQKSCKEGSRVSWPQRDVPEYGSPGSGVNAASVGLCIIPCGEIANWSRRTSFLSIGLNPVHQTTDDIELGFPYEKYWMPNPPEFPHRTLLDKGHLPHDPGGRAFPLNSVPLTATTGCGTTPASKTCQQRAGREAACPSIDDVGASMSFEA